MTKKKRQTRLTVEKPKRFTRRLTNIRLRPYQLEAFEAIKKSIFQKKGQRFVLLFARQSGKDELLANLIVYVCSPLAAATNGAALRVGRLCSQVGSADRSHFAPSEARPQNPRTCPRPGGALCMKVFPIDTALSRRFPVPEIPGDSG